MPIASRAALAVAASLSVIALTAGCGGPPDANVGGGGELDLVAAALAAGQPARVIVLLDEAPAVSAALMAGEPAAATDAAVSVLDATKSSVLADGSGDDVEVITPLRTLPAMHVELRSPAALARLRARPEVVRVVPDEPHEASLAESLPLIHQPAGFAAGATGQGTAVAVLDTGVDYTRAAFGSCSAAGAPGCKVAFARDFAPDDGRLDAVGHGTNVAGIVLGVAPQTTILSLDVFNGQYAYSSDILAAIDWVVQNRAAYHIAAMNLSLGSGGYTASCPSDTFAGAIHTARVAGVLAAIASGNNGYTNMISSPACAPDAVSVGAVWDASYGPQSFSACSDATTAADRVTCFSNSAPFLTVLAPGAYITAAGITMAGTSQATPHVAGAIAALRSLYPGETPDQTVARLRSGPVITDPRNGVQTPRLDLGGLTRPGCVVGLTPATAALSGAGASAVLTVSAPSDCAWTASSGAASWLTLSPASGTGPATITATAAPNAGAPRAATVTVGSLSSALSQAKDATLPTGDVGVAGAPRYTRSLKVALVARAADPVGVTQMCVANAARPCAASGWRPYAPSFDWTLAGGVAGPRSVYVWFKDAAGNVGGPATASIVYDNLAPSGGSFVAIRAAGQATLSWSGFTDRGSGVVASWALRYQPGSAPRSCSAGAVLASGAGGSGTFVHTGLVKSATYGYRLCPTDAAGNVGGKTLTLRGI